MTHIIPVDGGAKGAFRRLYVYGTMAANYDTGQIIVSLREGYNKDRIERAVKALQEEQFVATRKPGKDEIAISKPGADFPSFVATVEELVFPGSKMRVLRTQSGTSATG